MSDYRPLSAKTISVWQFIAQHIRDFGNAPSLEEIRIAFGWRSVSVSRHHVQRLIECGALARTAGTKRGLRLLRHPEHSTPSKLDRQAADLQEQGALIYWNFNAKYKRFTAFIARFPDRRPSVIVENQI